MRINETKLFKLRHYPKLLAEYLCELSAPLTSSVYKGKAWADKTLAGLLGQALLDKSGSITDLSFVKVRNAKNTHDIAFWAGVGSVTEPVYHSTRATINALQWTWVQEQAALYAIEQESKESEHYNRLAEGYGY